MTLLTNFFPLYILPEELTLRDFSTSAIIGYGLFASFVFIAVAKLFKSDIFEMLFYSNFKVKNINVFLKENYALNRPESFLLIINFFVSSTLILYILLDFPETGMNLKFLFSVFFPIGLFFFSVLVILVTSLLFGEYKTIQQLMFFRILGVQLLGIIFMILGLTWLLSNQSFESFLLAVVIVTILEFLVRVLKGGTSVLQKNIPWYYIILYFCTLEILPLIILFYYIKEFSS